MPESMISADMVAAATTPSFPDPASQSAGSTDTFTLVTPASRRAARAARLSPHERRLLRDLGVRVEAARKKKRLTRAQLSILTEISVAHLGSIERGSENATLLTVARLAYALDTTVVQLVAPSF